MDGNPYGDASEEGQMLLYSTATGISQAPRAISSTPSSFSLPRLFRLFLYALAFSLPSVGLMLFSQTSPETTRKFIAAVDVAGITTIGKAQIERQQAIARLPITREEKDVLIKGSVFMGATPEMVTLALGKAQSQQEVEGATVMTYMLAGDTSPTTFYFAKGVLFSARSGNSTLLPPAE